MTDVSLFDMKPGLYKRYAELVRKTSGLDFADQFQHLLLKAVQERIRQQSSMDYGSYYESLRSSPQEYQHLERSLTTGETYFFRYPQQFNYLRHQVLPELCTSKNPSSEQPVRIWSAGCSTGEEPYSLAILLEEDWKARWEHFSILGTDLNSDSLDHAARGDYNSYSFRTENKSFRDRFFEPHQGRYILNETIRKRVEFKKLNLLHMTQTPVFPIRYHIIFCRNVLIYFDPKTVLRIQRYLYQLLEDGGYLFLGHSESWHENKLKDEMTPCGYSIYRKTARNAVKVNTHPVNVPRPKSIPSPLGKIADTQPVRPPEPQLKKQNQPRENTVAELYENGLAAYKDKNFTLAETLFTAALDKMPQSKEVQLALAFLYSDQGKMGEALQLCEALLNIDRLNADAYFLNGLICVGKQQLTQAEASFRRCVYCDENHILGLYYLASLLDDQGLDDKAGRVYVQVFDLLNHGPEPR